MNMPHETKCPWLFFWNELKPVCEAKRREHLSCRSFINALMQASVQMTPGHLEKLVSACGHLEELGTLCSGRGYGASQPCKELQRLPVEDMEELQNGHQKGRSLKGDPRATRGWDENLPGSGTGRAPT
jgi:hypothetical protein